MTPGHTWLDCISNVLRVLGRVVAPVRNERDKQGALGSVGLSGLICLVILINGINEVCSI